LDRLKYAPGFPEIRHVARSGLTRDFIQPANGLRLQGGLVGRILRVEHFHLHLDGILAPLYPTLSLFTSFAHIGQSKEKMERPVQRCGRSGKPDSMAKGLGLMPRDKNINPLLGPELDRSDNILH
jgi:hypothetical protein